MVTDVEFKPVSLLIRIKNATTADELLALYAEGSGYKYASNNTRRKWSDAVDVVRKRIHQESRAEIESKHKPKPKPKPKPRPRRRDK